MASSSSLVLVSMLGLLHVKLIVKKREARASHYKLVNHIDCIKLSSIELGVTDISLM